MCFVAALFFYLTTCGFHTHTNTTTRHYRKTLIRLRETNAVQGGSQGGSNKGGGDNAKIKEIKGKLVQMNLQNLQIKSDKEKVFEKLVEFKGRYKELVGAKARKLSRPKRETTLPMSARSSELLPVPGGPSMPQSM